jgi:hypothetical protein
MLMQWFFFLFLAKHLFSCLSKKKKKKKRKEKKKEEAKEI